MTKAPSPFAYVTKHGVMINARMDLPFVARLDAICQETGLSRSDVLRAALAYFMDSFDNNEISLTVPRPEMSRVIVIEPRKTPKKSSEKRPVRRAR